MLAFTLSQITQAERWGERTEAKSLYPFWVSDKGQKAPLGKGCNAFHTAAAPLPRKRSPGATKDFPDLGVGRQVSWSLVPTPLESRNPGTLWSKKQSIPAKSPTLEVGGWGKDGQPLGKVLPGEEELWDSPGGEGVGAAVAGGVGGALLLPGRTRVGACGVVSAGTVVAKGVVGAGPVVVGKVVGVGLVVARGVVGVRSTAGGGVDEGPRGA